MKTDIEWLQEASKVGESSDWMSWPSVDPARIARVLQAHEAERQRADMANQQYLRVVSERDDATDELEELKDELADLKGEQVPVYQQLIYSEWHDCDEGDYRCADKDSRRVLFTAPQKPVVPVGFLFVVKATGAVIYSIADAAIDGTQLIGKIYGDTAIGVAGGIAKDGES